MGPGDLAAALAPLERRSDPRILVGRETFDDAGVWQLSPELALVQTLDFFAPIVDDPYDFGRVAATNALSDVFAMGGEPITAMNIVRISRRAAAAQRAHRNSTGRSGRRARGRRPHRRRSHDHR